MATRILLSVAVVLVVCGCSASHERGDDPTPEDDSDAGTVDTTDAGPLRRDAGPADAGPPDVVMPDDRIPLTEEEAECLGLTDPPCASCHFQEGMWVLRPDGPPPPPGTMTIDPADCGVMLP